MILFVGHVDAHKGALDLVRAFAVVSRARRDASLVMVGTGPCLGQCRGLAKALGVSVRFVGARPHAEIPDWLAAADVLALPSWAEGTPNVVLEALACGRRVVATAVGGIPDVVSSDRLGTLVPPRDPPALARALEAALSTPYDPASVSAGLDVPDWAGSARLLYGSLLATLRHRASEAA